MSQSKAPTKPLPSTQAFIPGNRTPRWLWMVLAIIALIIVLSVGFFSGSSVEKGRQNDTIAFVQDQIGSERLTATESKRLADDAQFRGATARANLESTLQSEQALAMENDMIAQSESDARATAEAASTNIVETAQFETGRRNTLEAEATALASTLEADRQGRSDAEAQSTDSAATAAAASNSQSTAEARGTAIALTVLAENNARINAEVAATDSAATAGAEANARATAESGATSIAMTANAEANARATSNAVGTETGFTVQTQIAERVISEATGTRIAETTQAEESARATADVASTNIAVAAATESAARSTADAAATFIAATSTADSNDYATTIAEARSNESTALAAVTQARATSDQAATQLADANSSLSTQQINAAITATAAENEVSQLQQTIDALAVSVPTITPRITQLVRSETDLFSVRIPVGWTFDEFLTGASLSTFIFGEDSTAVASREQNTAGTGVGGVIVLTRSSNNTRNVVFTALDDTIAQFDGAERIGEVRSFGLMDGSRVVTQQIRLEPMLVNVYVIGFQDVLAVAVVSEPSANHGRNRGLLEATILSLSIPPEASSSSLQVSAEPPAAMVTPTPRPE